MPAILSEEELARLERAGQVKPAGAPPAAHSLEALSARVVDLAAQVQELVRMTRGSEDRVLLDAMQRQTQMMMQALALLAPPKSPWTFKVQRDSEGRIVSLTAEHEQGS